MLGNNYYKIFAEFDVFYYIDSITGQNQSEPVLASFYCFLSSFFWDLDVPRTGLARSSSPEGSRTGTGPDFKALVIKPL